MKIADLSLSHKDQVKIQKRNRWKDIFTSYLFLIPALSFLFVFSIVPIFYLIWLSFHQYQLPNPAMFIGLDNFKQLFSDSLFFKSVLNTLKYTVGSMVVGLSAALLIAVILYQRVRGTRFYKVFYFLPTVTSEVITAMIFLWIFDNNLGILNYVLTKFGVVEPPMWLMDANLAMLVIILVGAWRGASYNIPIFLAGLEGISKSYYEAADIDGANGWHKFWYITIPSLMPVITYCVVMSVIGSFQVVAIVDILTNGGPLDSTLVVIKYVWQQAFEFNYVGYGATLALFLFPILFAITWLQIKLSSRGE